MREKILLVFLKKELKEDYFDLVVPSALTKKLYETKNEFVELIKVGWSNLKDKIEKNV